MTIIIRRVHEVPSLSGRRSTRVGGREESAEGNGVVHALPAGTTAGGARGEQGGELPQGPAAGGVVEAGGRRKLLLPPWRAPVAGHRDVHQPRVLVGHERDQPPDPDVAQPWVAAQRSQVGRDAANILS